MTPQEIMNGISQLFTNESGVSFRDFVSQMNDAITAIKNTAVDKATKPLTTKITELEGDINDLKLEPIDSVFLSKYKNEKVDNVEVVKRIMNFSDLPTDPKERQAEITARTKTYESAIKSFEVDSSTKTSNKQSAVSAIESAISKAKVVEQTKPATAKQAVESMDLSQLNFSDIK